MGRRGPQPRGEFEDKSAVFSTRIRADTRAWLEETRKASGRSLSQQVEFLLRRARDEDGKIEQAFGSRRTYALMRLIASVAEVILTTKGRKGLDWLDDPYRFGQVQQAINAVLDAIRPNGKIGGETGSRMQGQVTAAETLREVQIADSSLPLTSTRRQHVSGKIKADLGEVVERAQVFGRTPEETRQEAEAARQFAPLYRKLDRGEKLTVAERRELDRSTAVIERIQKRARKRRSK
jgi:hypothetical protein